MTFDEAYDLMSNFQRAVEDRLMLVLASGRDFADDPEYKAASDRQYAAQQALLTSLTRAS